MLNALAIGRVIMLRYAMYNNLTMKSGFQIDLSGADRV